jgi:hypothetical protein
MQYSPTYRDLFRVVGGGVTTEGYSSGIPLTLSFKAGISTDESRHLDTFIRAMQAFQHSKTQLAAFEFQFRNHNMPIPINQRKIVVPLVVN